MKNNKFKSKKFYLSSLLLVGFVSLTNVSCGKNIDELFFTVKGKDLEVTFCDRGASIYSIKYKDTVVTYHPKDKSTFLKDDYYYGKTLGRVAGRIKDGKLKVDGKDYQLEVNETSGKKHNSLHGGKNSFAARDFKHYIEEKNDTIKVSFNYLSPSLEAGFPEVMDSWFVYTIYKNESKIDLNITANVSGTTPCNLSTHPFFRLSNDGDILDHTLEIKSSKMAQYDEKGEDQTVENFDKDVADTPWDFRDAKKIGKDIEEAKSKDPVSRGYDHIWKFDDDGEENYVELKNPKTNLSLKVTSDADAVILYSNCYPHEGMEINPSGTDTLFSGITIEPIKSFTKYSVEDLNITPDKPFSRYISYKFSTEK